jgi:hypothetical protein
LPFSSSLSVLRFGVVQVSVTWLPARLALKSETSSGRLSEGGCGVPGVPQPDTASPAASASTTQSIFCIVLIAFQSKGVERL